MSHFKNLILLVVIGSLTGCVLVSRRGPKLGVDAMNRGEAISLGTSECRSRGFHCDLKEAHQTGSGKWKVKFRVARNDARGHLHLEYDRWGALLDVDEKVKDKRHHRDDDDDDRRGRGRHHGASAGRHD